MDDVISYLRETEQAEDSAFATLNTALFTNEEYGANAYVTGTGTTSLPVGSSNGYAGADTSEPAVQQQLKDYWSRLDANRECKERYHEIGRSDVPLECGMSPDEIAISAPNGRISQKQAVEKK